MTRCQSTPRTMRPRHTVITLAVLIFAGWCPPPAGATAGDVTIEDSDFEPGFVRIDAPGEVVWTHTGRRRHTVTADDGSFDSGVLGPRTSFQRTFHQVGRYPYHCRFHGGQNGKGMSGVVIVDSEEGLPLPDPPLPAR